MNNRIRWSFCALTLVTGSVFAQFPAMPQQHRPRPMYAPAPAAAMRPIQAIPASAKKQIPNDAIAPMPAHAAAPIAATPVGCSSCGQGGGYAAGGCNSGPGFVGGCCDYLRPNARGVWNGYCDQGCFGGFFGCNSPLLGGCCTKMPIGLYGATPMGCCAAGVGPRHGWECGGCGPCGSMGRTAGCGTCFAGATRTCGWRMGAGGHPCAPPWSAPSCGCDGGGEAAVHQPTPAAAPVTNNPPEAPELPSTVKSARAPVLLQPITYPGVR